MTAPTPSPRVWRRPLDPATVLRTAAKYVAVYGWHCPPGFYGSHPVNPRRPEMLPASMLGAIRAAVVGSPKWWLATVPPPARTVIGAGHAAAVEHLVWFLETVGHADLATVAWLWERNPTRVRRDVVEALTAAAGCASVLEPTPNALGDSEGSFLAPVVRLPVRPRSAAAAADNGDVAALIPLVKPGRRSA